MEKKEEKEKKTSPHQIPFPNTCSSKDSYIELIQVYSVTSIQISMDLPPNKAKGVEWWWGRGCGSKDITKTCVSVLSTGITMSEERRHFYEELHLTDTCTEWD